MDQNVIYEILHDKTKSAPDISVTGKRKTKLLLPGRTALHYTVAAISDISCPTEISPFFTGKIPR